MNHWDVPHLAEGSTPPQVDPDRVTVYNMRFCPFAQRTILVLLAKNIPFDVVNINLKKKPEWFLKETWGLVSVVRYKDNYIMESLINSDFIDELFPSHPLHPTDPFEKAKGRLQVESFCKMNGPYYKMWYAAADSAEERSKQFSIIVSKLEEMDKELKRTKSKFFGGSSPGMTDLMVWPFMERMPVLDLFYPEEGLVIPARLENLVNWVKDMWEVPAIKQYGLEPEVHLKYRQSYSNSTGVPDYDLLLK